MNTPLNETVKSPTGLEVGRAVVTSLQIRRGDDGQATIVMTDGTATLRIAASPDQVEHLIGLLSGRAAGEAST